MRIFENRNMVFVTKHSKESVVSPIMEKETGCNVIVESRFDTDKLGTFSRECDRTESQLNTARIKINEGMKLQGIDIGIASEGSFGSHPFVPIPWNTEIVLLFDKKENLEIYGIYEGPQTNYNHMLTSSYEDVLEFAKKIGFPEHYLILRPDNEYSSEIIMEIHNYEKLFDAFKRCAELSKTGVVFIETDMRAYANPTRMRNIGRATQDLVSKLLSLCPECGAPGFIVKDIVRGLPCEDCNHPSKMPLKYKSDCYKCGHSEENLYPKGQFASPMYCDICNP